MASGSTDGRAIVWDLRVGQPAFVLEGHDGRVGHVAFSPDGRFLATRDVLTVRLWDADSGKALARHTADRNLSALAWAPDGKRVLIGARDGTVVAWDHETGTRTSMKIATRAILDLAAGPKPSTVAATGEGGSVSVWEIGSSDIRKLPDHAEIAFKAAWHPDGRRLLTAGSDGTIRILKLR